MSELVPRDLRQAIERWTRENCGWENSLHLEMDQIWRCPAELYDRMTKEQRAFGQAARYCYEEYLHKRDMMERVTALNAYRPWRELEAEWSGGQFLGHVDGVLVWDETVALLEIKSVSAARFGEVKEHNRALQSHYEQVQTYLLYGEWETAVVIYKNRETGEVWPVVVWPHVPTQERLEQKARDVLAAVETGVRPVCECGRHRDRG